MKIIVVTKKDLEKLRTAINVDPAFGFDGGSSYIVHPETRKIYEEVHRFYNYQISRWLSEIEKEADVL